MDETYLPVLFDGFEAQMKNNVEYQEDYDVDYHQSDYNHPGCYLRYFGNYEVQHQRSHAERGNHAEHEVENGASSGETAYLGFSALEHEQTEHEERGDENCPENIGSQRWRGPFFCRLFCHSFNGR